MSNSQTFECPTCIGRGFNYRASDCVPSMRTPESQTEPCSNCEGTGRIEGEATATIELQVFQNRINGVQGVVRVRDPRPDKTNAYSAAMPIYEAVKFALTKARSHSIDVITVDDPHGRLFPLEA